jgi:hypothetical protein
MWKEHLKTMQQYTTQTTSEVFCSLRVDGLHNWPECPFEEVDFLRPLHRHMFHIKAYVPVTHSDRDVEFIVLKHKITQFLRDQYWDEVKQTHVFGRMSCEAIAEQLHLVFGLSACEVSEDGENGSFTRWATVWAQ